MPNAAEHIHKKLPSMYDQFKKLADIDITKEPMEVGPTTHYMMGGVKVDADTQMSTVPGLFAAGEVAAGLHGANRLGGNSLSDLLVFGKRAGEHAALFAKQNGYGNPDEGIIASAIQEATSPFDNLQGENPYQVQYDLQEMMQDLVGIVRNEEELLRAKEELVKLNSRAHHVRVTGHREYNNGWHTALDLKNLMTVSQAVTLAAIQRKESRGAHFREDYPAKDDQLGKFNSVIRKGRDGEMEISKSPLLEIRDDLKTIIEELK
jgi:succinate dehydrogenase / fumarate reductase flavoprotein subunit